MPIEKSQRVAARKRERNVALKSKAKTYISKAKGQIERKEVSLAQETVRQAIVALDKAASKGVIHPNNAARRKSRLMKKLNAAKTTSS